MSSKKRSNSCSFVTRVNRLVEVLLAAAQHFGLLCFRHFIAPRKQFVAVFIQPEQQPSAVLRWHFPDGGLHLFDAHAGKAYFFA